MVSKTSDARLFNLKYNKATVVYEFPGKMDFRTWGSSSSYGKCSTWVGNIWVDSLFSLMLPIKVNVYIYMFACNSPIWLRCVEARLSWPQRDSRQMPNSSNLLPTRCSSLSCILQTHTQYIQAINNIWFNDIWEITVSKQLIYLKYTIKHMEIKVLWFSNAMKR